MSSIDFWGDHVDGKLMDILKLIGDDNPDIQCKVLPALEKGIYGSPQVLLSDKPSSECLDKIKELYKVRIFTDEDNTDYRYLMSIETLRYNYEQGWHFKETTDLKDILHNRWDFDGYFYITDSFNSRRRIAIIPFSSNAYEFGGGDNISKGEALIFVKSIVKQLNNGEIIDGGGL